MKVPNCTRRYGLPSSNIIRQDWQRGATTCRRYISSPVKSTVKVSLLFCTGVKPDFQECSQNCEKRVLTVYPSVCPNGKTRLPLDGFSWKWIFEDFFFKSVEKIQDSLKSDKNNQQFTWRPIHSYDNISLNSPYNDKCFRQQFWRKSKHTLLFKIPTPKTTQFGAWMMRFAC